VFGACSVVSAFFIMKFVNESKGKEIEEMQG